jgi:uncharacterized protein GlcG (DUF336 family)
MGYIVTTRNPRSGKLVVIVENDEGDVSEFKTEDEANAAAAETTVCKAWGYQLVEID